MSWNCSLTEPLQNRNRPMSWAQSQGHLLTKPKFGNVSGPGHGLVFNTPVITYVVCTDLVRMIHAGLVHFICCLCGFWLLTEWVVTCSKLRTNASVNSHSNVLSFWETFYLFIYFFVLKQSLFLKCKRVHLSHSITSFFIMYQDQLEVKSTCIIFIQMYK